MALQSTTASSLQATIHAALGVEASDGAALRALTHEEVVAKLKAADLGGLSSTVWDGIKQLRQASPQTLPSSSAAAAASTPPYATNGAPAAPALSHHRRQPSEPYDRRAARFVPTITFMHGRVPRSEEKWQYYEGEGTCTGFYHCFGLTVFNLIGMISKDHRDRA